MFSRLPLLSEEHEPDPFLGRSTFLLLDDPSCWVHRRVEQVDFLDSASVRRQMSVDFDVPSGGAEPRASSILIPLTLLEKRPLVELDVRDESGGAVPVLNAEENGFVAWSLLANVVQVALEEDEGAVGSIPRKILDGLKTIAGGSPEEALAALDSIAEGADADVRERLALPLFREYAEWIAAKFMLLVEVPVDDQVRRVMKVSYTQPLERVGTSKARWQRWVAMMGWRPAQFDIDVPGAAEGQTYHCEFHGPPGLEVTRAELGIDDALDPGGTVVYRGEVVGSAAHIYASDISAGVEGFASVWLIHPRAGFVRAALAISAVIAGLFLFFAHDGRIARVGNDFPLPLLLAAPGVVAGFILRPGEHRIATDLLAGVRGAVAAAALASYAGAVALGAGVTQTTVLSTWRCLGIGTLMCFTSLSVAYCFGSYRGSWEEPWRR